MSDDRVVVSGGGIGITGLLTIIFVFLKVFGKIDWSWWWVFAPLWIPFALGLTALIVVGILWLIAVIADR